MKLYPQDLRSDDHARVVLKRSFAASGSTNGTSATYNPDSPLPEPKLGTLGKLWSKGLGMSDKQAAVGNAAAAMGTGTSSWVTTILGPFIPGVIVAILAKKGAIDPATAWLSFSAMTTGLAALGFGPFAKGTFRSLHKPLQTVEIEALIKEALDPLETAYLLLVRDAILTDASAKAEADIRVAIEALGAAIEKLPAVSLEPVDVAVIRADAIALHQQALVEPDRVTADSLTRRADALERRAAAYEHSAVLAKRAAALRAEIHAQIETLRAGLAGHQLEEGVGPTVVFAELSETARRVAQEAASAAEAKQELAQVQL
jgi:hypothetical protein